MRWLQGSLHLIWLQNLGMRLRKKYWEPSPWVRYQTLCHTRNTELICFSLCKALFIFFSFEQRLVHFIYFLVWSIKFVFLEHAFFKNLFFFEQSLVQEFAFYRLYLPLLSDIQCLIFFFATCVQIIFLWCIQWS